MPGLEMLKQHQISQLPLQVDMIKCFWFFGERCRSCVALPRNSPVCVSGAGEGAGLRFMKLCLVLLLSLFGLKLRCDGWVSSSVLVSTRIPALFKVTIPDDVGPPPARFFVT